LGAGVEVVGGGGEKNESAVEGGDEFGDDAAEDVAVGLNGENGGDGVGGIGPELDRVGNAEIGEFGIEVECFAEGAAKFVPVDLQRREVLDGERDVVAFTA